MCFQHKDFKFLLLLRTGKHHLIIFIWFLALYPQFSASDHLGRVTTLLLLQTGLAPSLAGLKMIKDYFIIKVTCNEPLFSFFLKHLTLL